MPSFFHRHRTFIALLAAGLAVMAIPAAHAQTPVSPELRAKAYKVLRTCKADIQQLCRGIEYGGGRIAKCLQAHETSVTPGCRAALTEVLTP
ncbi:MULTISPECIES: cysteine rich repeat-containing protein [Alphaproteobacteria]|uniref:Cysteine rich repeat protein n=2 Tax=Alphaproteobacteria TaxID=28211 RepID=A0A512HDF7_9HYPH|nr:MULTISPECIES: cysteine rich repeat-containing protein [Alphaproteobacteria]GEO83475.1 hypothetical protein RNA01_04070 [Ciceribacter naphthalenivorans]GLR24374.1 hypothetical protein GCM10007920_41680 [Ciceribacter naphthalenivorans]GLT07230.1 hypothetical protein GCM10007926_41680 [Sphingomonas psychrolutea]